MQEWKFETDSTKKSELIEQINRLDYLLAKLEKPYLNDTSNDPKPEEEDDESSHECTNSP